jgi:hypothetical protein
MARLTEFHVFGRSHVCCFHAFGAETLKRVRAGAGTGRNAISLSHPDAAQYGQGAISLWLRPGENSHSS